MQSIVITLHTANSAFDETKNCEIARILRGLADKLENGSQPEKLQDINGNTVGTVEYIVGGE